MHKSTYSKSHIEEFARILLLTVDDKKVKNCFIQLWPHWWWASTATCKCDELKTTLLWLWRIVCIFLFILW